MSFRRMRHVKAREVQGCTMALDASTPSMYDATSGGSLVAADGAVARWEDQSGNGNHVTQGTSGRQPTRKVSEANGYGSASFDGGDGLDSASGASSVFWSATANTVIAAIKQDSGKTQNALLAADHINVSGGVTLWATYDNTLYWDAPNTSARLSVAQPAGWVDAFKVLTTWRDAGAVAIRVNSASIASATGKTGSVSYAANALIVGSNLAPPSNASFGGHIAALSIYSVALPTPVIRRIEHAAMRKTRIKSA
jgi:hypothetical protein